MIHELFSNPIVSGGAGLMMLGGLLAMARSLPARAVEWIKDHILTSIEIDNTDPAFPWVKAWLASKGKSRYLTAGILNEDAGMTSMPKEYDPSAKPKFSLCPRGLCTFRHRGRRILGWLSKVEVQNSKEWREVITLKAMAVSQSFFVDLLNDAHELATGRDGSTVQVWVPNGAYWNLHAKKPSRSLETIVMADGVAESVIADARRFLSERQWYQDRGIPHRRGYLWEGPPGNGKSSLAHALASALKMNINVATMSSFCSDQEMGAAMARVPSGHILLLEDIDATRRDPGTGFGPSFSALLNAIDGMAAQEGRILIMTTNHVENLDPALIRPGRADVRLRVGNADSDQAGRMFLKFFPGHHRHARQFGSAWAGQSMAEIQKHLLIHRDCPDEATMRGIALAA